MSDIPPPPPPGAQPPPYPGGAPVPAPQKAGPWPRLGARIIDGFVMLIPTAIVNGALGVNTFGSTFSADDVGKIFIAGVINAALITGYFVLMESNNGQSVGKMVLSMRVYGAAGGNPTTEESLKRNAFNLLQAVPIIGGFAALVVVIAIAVGISNDPRGQGPHDRFAGGTLVVKT